VRGTWANWRELYHCQCNTYLVSISMQKRAKHGQLHAGCLPLSPAIPEHQG